MQDTDFLNLAIEAAERFQNNMNPQYDTGHILQAIMYALLSSACDTHITREAMIQDIERRVEFDERMLRAFVESLGSQRDGR